MATVALQGILAAAEYLAAAGTPDPPAPAESGVGSPHAGGTD